MKSKSHGSASLSDEEAEQAKEDFFYACDCTAEMLEGFAEEGLHAGPAIGGALTQIIAHLIQVSPDTSAAMQLLSSCITNATMNIETKHQTHPSSDQVH